MSEWRTREQEQADEQAEPALQWEAALLGLALMGTIAGLVARLFAG